VPELYFDLARHFPSLLRDSRPEPPQRDGTDFTKIQNGFLFRSRILQFWGGDCFCRDRTDWCSAPSFWPGLSLALSRGRGSHVARTQDAGNFVSSWAPQKRTYTLPHRLRFATSADSSHSRQPLHITSRYTSTWRIYLPIFAFVHRESVLERATKYFNTPSSSAFSLSPFRVKPLLWKRR
jgi:hypothetical protein